MIGSIGDGKILILFDSSILLSKVATSLTTLAATAAIPNATSGFFIFSPPFSAVNENIEEMSLLL